VTSPLEKSRDIGENGGRSVVLDAPEVVSTPEVVSGHLAAALRSMTSPFHGVIMAAGPLIFPHPVPRPPLLPLVDLASCRNFGTLPEVVRQCGVDSASESGSGSGNRSTICDDDCEDGVNGVSSAVAPLDLSPPRCALSDNLHRYGNSPMSYYVRLISIT